MPHLENDLSNVTSLGSSAYLKTLPESHLADHQRSQVGNSCTLHCIRAAFKLLNACEIDPTWLAEELDALPFFRRIRYRGWKNGPVTPLQQVALIRRLAEDMSLPVSASLAHPAFKGLISLIGQPETVVLTTIGWRKDHAPAITHGTDSQSFADNLHLNWHTMVAAAYDPLHIDKTGVQKPWGFINSWTNGGKSLFWMSNLDFQRSWSFYTPFGGKRPAVVITRK
jgi:hypothetical protein